MSIFSNTAVFKFNEAAFLDRVNLSSVVKEGVTGSATTTTGFSAS